MWVVRDVDAMNCALACARRVAPLSPARRAFFSSLVAFRIRKNAVARRPPARGGEDDDPRCPLSFRLGSAHSAHFGAGASSRAAAAVDAAAATADAATSPAQKTGVGTHTPPLIYPLHPDFDAGSGRQILLTTDYEVLEMWTPSGAIDHGGGPSGSGGGQSAEQMKEDEQYPLLFEGSSFFHTSPVVHDLEGDGVADAILGDYDGNLHLVGLDFERAASREGGRRKRYYRRISVPRLFVRKGWYEAAINRTREEDFMAHKDATGEAAGEATGGEVAIAANATAGNRTKRWEEFEPYHTYFASDHDTAWRGKKDEVRIRRRLPVWCSLQHTQPAFLMTSSFFGLRLDRRLCGAWPETC